MDLDVYAFTLPMTLDKEADQVAVTTPIWTNGLQNVNWSMYIQSLWSKTGSQVRLVSKLSNINVMKVVRQADNVPRGMFLPEKLNELLLFICWTPSPVLKQRQLGNPLKTLSNIFIVQTLYWPHLYSG